MGMTPSTAEVLPGIVDALEGKLKIFVDGGIRSGVDIFKALALGADACIICRPFVTAAFGGDAEGIRFYIEKLGSELSDTMTMCGANALEEITSYHLEAYNGEEQAVVAHAHHGHLDHLLVRGEDACHIFGAELTDDEG